jgi:glycolate oxidase FAD binding subunit
MSGDQTDVLQQTVAEAFAEKRSLRIVGGNTKAFYVRDGGGQPLTVSAHQGIIRYEPSELFVTVRSGTRLVDLEAELATHGQMLPFEPPCFGEGATVGGMIACGLSGPRRPWSGAVRDAVLGLTCINGQGQALRFGGEVVKNVAGFDVSRLMVGALGTLGVVLDASLKLLPRPECEQTLIIDGMTPEDLNQVRDWGQQGHPLSAVTLDEDRLYVRLSGVKPAVRQAMAQIGGAPLSEADGAAWWDAVRDHQHTFFRDQRPLWRISLPVAKPPLNIIGDWFYDWAGAQRWLKTALQSTIIREMVVRAGGHAQLFRGGDRQAMIFQPLSPGLLKAHKALKSAFDPAHVLNRGCLYPEF